MRSELCSLVLGASMLGLLACPDRTQPQMQASGVTAMDQSNAAVDVELTRSIRQAIAQNESMSLNARNVKVIAQSGGLVTLRGPVDGELEREAIVGIAMRTPGVTRVDDQLEIARE